MPPDGTHTHTLPSALGDLLKRLFPPRDGGVDVPTYLAFPRPDGTEPHAYETPPILPPDTFAAAAYMLELSGAYHHVVPDMADRPARQARLLVVSGADIAAARRVAAAWRSFRPDRHYEPDAPDSFTRWLADAGAPLHDLFSWWHQVFSANRDTPVFQALDSAGAPPAWWKPAVMLLMAADEAAVGIGYRVAPSGEDADAETVSGWAEEEPWTSLYVHYQIGAAFRRQGGGAGEPSAAVLFEGVGSVSTASQDVAAVLPKARTAAVGCTMRSMSHHLALLPPRGVARASWTPSLGGTLRPHDRQMNLLLVPFPFTIPARAFRPTSHFTDGGIHWGFFDVEQTWLQDVSSALLLDFIKALADEASKECSAIHGIVLPEMALDQPTYIDLSRDLPNVLPDLEIFIAGQSGETGGRPGNFVSVTLYQQKGSSEGGERRAIVSRREKHHRWKLDRLQVLDYGLEGILSPSLSWWEDIDLLSRRVDFSVVRTGTVFSAMICEDLARIDPCQELLRAVGPSVVVALLMDAPQLRFRWPGRYATILAEDPGTAVLTLTSRALMTRQNRLGRHLSAGDGDRIVALWRDDSGEPREIACPMSAHGVRLTLSGQSLVDAALDGRNDRNAVSWRWASHAPIRVPEVKEKFAKILGEDDLACQA